MNPSAATLEELHGAFVLLGGRTRAERAEITALSRFRVLLARIETISSVLQLANHGRSPALDAVWYSLVLTMTVPAAALSRFLDNACPDHHVRGGPDHVRAAHTAMRLLARYPDIPRADFYS